MTEDLVTEYIAWCVNVRKNRSRGLAVKLGIVYAALRNYPPIKGMDLKWIALLKSGLPQDPEELIRAAKEAKWVSYDDLWQIPSKIRRELARNTTNNWRAALLCQEALLISWLLMLPWRQRNVRQMKLGRFENGGNLCKCRVPASSTIAKPAWVQEALRAYPQGEFWQFHFRSEETKTRHTVLAFVPNQLICLLEEFLEHHRPHLIRGNDPGTLFINRKGKPFDSMGVENLVGQVTLRHSGRRVNPHLFRDIFALKWLEDHPEDYLTLAKILWHRSVTTTIRYYGQKFDESHGARSVDQWLERRALHAQDGRQQ